MESMLNFLRDCLKHADLDTITKAHLKKFYLAEHELSNFPKDDKKLFSEAVRIALGEITMEKNSSNAENESNSKGEDVVTDEVSGNDKENHMKSDSDEDFAPDYIKESSFITEPASKKKSGRKILSDSEMSADEQDESDVQKVVINEEDNIGTDAKEKEVDKQDAAEISVGIVAKKSHSSLSEDDENSGDTTFKMRNKKKIQKIISDDESSLEVPVKDKSLSNGQKRLHISSSSENDANSSQNESSSSKTTTPKRKKIKISNGNHEKKSKKLSLAKNKSEGKKILESSDSEDEIVSKPMKKKKKSTVSNKSEAKSTKKNVGESEDEMLASLKNVSSDASNHSENESDSALRKTKSGKSSSKLDKLDTSESEDEPLKKFSKSKLSNTEVDDVTKSDEKNSSESEEDVPSKSKSPQNYSSDSEDEPIINLGKKSPKNVKKPNKKSAGKKEKDWSDSDDEPLGEKLNSSGHKKTDKSSPAKESSSQSSCSSVDENKKQSPISKKDSKPSKEENNSKSVKEKKGPSASENKIEHLKKYVRSAGIRVKSYTQLFEKCKSMKAKSEKLLELLEQHGLKGRPTLEKCKKLKKKIETKREIAELDLSNILKTDGRRSKRSVCSDATNEKVEKAPTPVKRFSRLQDIVDSEGSD